MVYLSDKDIFNSYTQMLNSQLLFDLSWWMVFDLGWRAFCYEHNSFCSVCPKNYCTTSVIICFQEANIEQWPILLTPCNKRKCCNHLFHHDWAWCKRFLCISLCFEPSRADPDYGERVMISHDKQYNKTNHYNYFQNSLSSLCLFIEILWYQRICGSIRWFGLAVETSWEMRAHK